MREFRTPNRLSPVAILHLLELPILHRSAPASGSPDPRRLLPDAVATAPAHVPSGSAFGARGPQTLPEDRRPRFLALSNCSTTKARRRARVRQLKRPIPDRPAQLPWPKSLAPDAFLQPLNRLLIANHFRLSSSKSSRSSPRAQSQRHADIGVGRMRAVL